MKTGLVNPLTEQETQGDWRGSTRLVFHIVNIKIQADVKIGRQIHEKIIKTIIVALINHCFLFRFLMFSCGFEAENYAINLKGVFLSLKGYSFNYCASPFLLTKFNLKIK